MGVDRLRPPIDDLLGQVDQVTGALECVDLDDAHAFRVGGLQPDLETVLAGFQLVILRSRGELSLVIRQILADQAALQRAVGRGTQQHEVLPAVHPVFMHQELETDEVATELTHLRVQEIRPDADEILLRMLHVRQVGYSDWALRWSGSPAGGRNRGSGHTWWRRCLSGLRGGLLGRFGRRLLFTLPRLPEHEHREGENDKQN